MPLGPEIIAAQLNCPYIFILLSVVLMLAPVQDKERYIHLDTAAGNFYILPDALAE